MMATDAGFRETLAYNCGPLFMDALKNPEVIEIMLNPDGMLWIERYGQDQEPIGTMEPVRLVMVSRYGVGPCSPWWPVLWI